MAVTFFHDLRHSTAASGHYIFALLRLIAQSLSGGNAFLSEILNVFAEIKVPATPEAKTGNYS
jgi:hypothetical protein